MLAVFCLHALMGCATSTQGRDAGPVFDAALVSGERLFQTPLPEHEIPQTRVLAVDDQMRAFVDTHVRKRVIATARFRDLLAGMASTGLTTPDYRADRTLPASETFHERSGNCLSYTNLFIALAREAGLDAVYQIVDVPPDWDVQTGFLIRYTHINVLVRNVRLGRGYENQVTVDFNDVVPGPRFHRRVVSDAYAESLYYANLAVAMIRVGDSRRGFAYLRRAIDIAPENESLWINLGALYATKNDYEASIQSFETALQIDPHSQAAMSGLARSHARAGHAELAAFYRQQARNYLEANPYYHFAVAHAAFAKGDYVQALAAADAAIELDGRVGRFHFLKGLAEQQLGRNEAAAFSFQRARRFGLESEAKLDYIRSLVGYNSRQP